MTQPRNAVLKTVVCPHCKAGIGHMCLRKNGRRRGRMHTARISAYLTVTVRVTTGRVVADPWDDMPLIEDWP